MDERPRGRRWMAAVTALAASCAHAHGPGAPGRPRSDAGPAERPPARAAEHPPLLENDDHVPGAPADDSEFEFDPEPGADAPEGAVLPPGLVLDGIDARELGRAPALDPYLRARRASVRGVGRDGKTVLVLTRLSDVTQAYRVQSPRGAREQLTWSEEPVAQASFVPGSTSELAFRSDVGGSEDYQIFRVFDDGGARLLTDGRSRHGHFLWSTDGRRLAYTANVTTPADTDVYLASATEPGRSRRIADLDGSWVIVAWSSARGELIVRRYVSFAESALYTVDDKTGSVEPLLEPRSGVAQTDARFGPDGREVHFMSTRDGELVRLYVLDRRTGDVRGSTPDIEWNVDEMALSRDGRTLAFTTNEDGWSVLHVLRTGSGQVTRPTGIPRGVISTLRFARDADVLAFTLDRPDAPGDAFTYDLERGELVQWTRSEVGGLRPGIFVSPRLVRYASFDGLEIPAWYYRPPGRGPFPVLIWVHGGPEEQTRPSFNPIIQYFVRELGVAVLAPNVRGSDGYGRRFLSLDDGPRREDAIRDIGALLDWIASRMELAEDRVGIYGASYGGYVVLASLVHFGKRIAAGCDVVGISDFVTFLENTRPYRRDQRRAEYGDERDPDMREHLRSISPLHRASEIESPLFVGHGANDPRVPVGEAEQIVQAVREAGQPVWYLLARDEGHGFRKRPNRDAFYRLMGAFFERHLIGEPSPPAGEVR